MRELQIEQYKLLLNSLASKMESLGFAKIRGHPFWPSEITGDMGGRLLVTFLGTNKTGTISKKRLKKEWLPLSQAITEKFSTPRNMKRSGFATGMKELMKNTPVTFPDDSRSQVDKEQNVGPEVGDEIDISLNHLQGETPEIIDSSDVESVPLMEMSNLALDLKSIVSMAST